MTNQKSFKKTVISSSGTTVSCGSKQSKAGANCKLAKNVSCRD